jgi:hypothetical protein
MKRMRRALGWTGLLAMTAASAQAPTGVLTLADLRDRARPLLIFAPKPDDPQLEIQLRTLAEHPSQASDRQIVPLALPFHAPEPTAAKLSEAEAVATRRRFNVAPGDFTVILIGKDGGEKLRSQKPLSMEKLNATIDAMPMRRDEMRQH